MTETDKPYLFEHDQKMTMTNINSLNSTENAWIWPKVEIIKKYHNNESRRSNLTEFLKYN